MAIRGCMEVFMLRYILLLTLLLPFAAVAHAEHNGGTPGPTGLASSTQRGAVLPLE